MQDICYLMGMFATYTRSLEVLWVMEGVKPSARFSVDASAIPALRSFCRKNDLAMELSSFRVIMDFSGRYSTKGRRVDSGNESGHMFCYIARDAQKAKEARDLEHENDHLGLGKALGYPECCCNFFAQHREEEVAGNNDYVLPALEGSGPDPYPFVNNIFGRYFDTCLLSHAPCRLDCKGSEEIGRKHLEILSRTSPQLKQIFEKFLKQPVIYHDGAAYVLEAARREGDILHFSTLLSSKDDWLSDRLQKAGHISVEKGRAVFDDISLHISCFADC